MVKITSQNQQKIEQFRKLFPHTIHVRVIPSMEEGYTVKIVEFPRAITQADNLADLIVMVSDCVATILEVPKKYSSYMPIYLPSVRLAQYMNEFPRSKVANDGKFLITSECGK